jgi:ACR3 family arsenite efflux pump ArsB
LSIIEKLEPLLLALAALAGLALGRLSGWGEPMSKLVQPLLIAMLLGVFWDIELKDLKKGFANLKFAAASLGLNFVWIPALGWLLARWLLAGESQLQIGFIMLLVTPCTDWYLVFTALARGNVPLSASILPINLLLQLLLLPAYLWLLGGLSGQADAAAILLGSLPVLLLPLGAARLLARLSRERPRLKGALTRLLPNLRFWYLWLAVAFMFAGEGRHIIDRPDIFLRLLAPVLAFFAINFAVGRLAGDLLRFPYPDSVSLSLTTLARNSPVALTVAVSAFPDMPLVALALVIGPLIELPTLGVVSKILLGLGRRRGVEGYR